MKVIKIRAHPYGRKIICCIGGNNKEVIKVLKKHYPKKKIKGIDVSDCDGYSYMFKDGLLLLWLKDKPKTAYQRGILSHEIVHIVDYLLGYVGVTRDGNANEAFAYLTGYITEKIYAKL